VTRGPLNKKKPNPDRIKSVYGREIGWVLNQTKFSVQVAKRNTRSKEGRREEPHRTRKIHRRGWKAGKRGKERGDIRGTLGPKGRGVEELPHPVLLSWSGMTSPASRAP